MIQLEQLNAIPDRPNGIEWVTNNSGASFLFRDAGGQSFARIRGTSLELFDMTRPASAAELLAYATYMHRVECELEEWAKLSKAQPISQATLNLHGLHWEGLFLVIAPYDLSLWVAAPTDAVWRIDAPMTSESANIVTRLSSFKALSIVVLHYQAAPELRGRFPDLTALRHASMCVNWDPQLRRFTVVKDRYASREDTQIYLDEINAPGFCSDSGGGLTWTLTVKN